MIDGIRSVVGIGNDDNGGVRGYGAQNLRRNVRRRSVRSGRRTHHCLARTCHRIQLCHVLQPYSGNLLSTILYSFYFIFFFFFLFFLTLKLLKINFNS